MGGGGQNYSVLSYLFRFWCGGEFGWCENFVVVIILAIWKDAEE